MALWMQSSYGKNRYMDAKQPVGICIFTFRSSFANISSRNANMKAYIYALICTYVHAFAKSKCEHVQRKI